MNLPVTRLTMLGPRIQETTADLSRVRDTENYPAPAVPGARAALLALAAQAETGPPVRHDPAVPDESIDLIEEQGVTVPDPPAARPG